MASVRVPPGGRNYGVSYESLFFDRHRHRDRIQWIVGCISGSRHDLVDHFYPAEDLSEYGIAPIQAAVISHADKELRAVVVEVARAIALARHFRHRYGAAFMRPVIRFGRQKVPGATRSMHGTVGVFAERVSALNQKARHDAMERRPIEEPHLGKVDEILYMAWGIVGVKADFDFAELRDDGGARIFFLKLDSHGG